jgi:Leucine-rich repeat (LRR) protein
VPSGRHLEEQFEASKPKLIRTEVVNQAPLALPKGKLVKGEPSIPPLIKVRRNEFQLSAEDSPRESLGLNREVLASLRSAMPGTSNIPAAFLHQPRERVLRRSIKDFDPGLAMQDPGQLGQNVDSVQLINFKGQNLEKVPKLWPNVARYALSLRVLVLSGCGLSKLDPIELPNLRLLDFSDNVLSKDTVLLSFLKGCLALQELDFRGNPIKDILSVIERVTALLPSLELVNGTTVELEARVRYVEAHHKRGKTFAQTVRWEWTVCSLSGVADSQLWEPQNIRKLILPKCNLAVFHVKPFVNLEILDLSDNLISNVVDSGISFCEALRVCDLRQNAIAKRDQLVAFQFNLYLKQLFLMGNEVAKLKEYRTFIIVSTRACYGSNRASGILEIDGVRVTLEERCAAIDVHSQKTVDVESLRWQLTCIEFFGRAQVESQAALAKYCILPLKSLSMANLEHFVKLRVLDLSRNSLTSVTGLEKLVSLIYLDLSNNPKLNLGQVLPQLTCSTLHQVVFFDDSKNHARSDPTKPVYRNQVLSALLLSNPNLNYVDEILISPIERVDTYARSGAADVELYRFRLACALQAMKLPRVLHPAYLDPEKKPYRYDLVTSLTNLADFGLTVANFVSFVALKELCLRNNKLTDIFELGLRGLVNLKKLDVANNLIRAPLPALAGFLDDLSSLQLVALSGNPCLKTSEDRAKLISLIRCMKEDFPHLRSIDTEITIRERVSVLVDAGAVSVDEGDNLRFRAIALQFIPIGIPAEQVTRLDFSNTGLRAAGLAKYVNLRVLLLKGNDIKWLSSIQGLEEMSRLEVLDLRNNLLSNLTEFSRLIESKLQSLQAIGLSGNKFRKDYRNQMLSDLRYLHLRKSALSSIDDEEITPAELFVAAQAAGTTKMIKDLQQFRFDIAFIRRSPDVPNRNLITELDLSSVGLELLNLDSFPNLKRVSLANNALNGKTLAASQIGTLRFLAFLNLNNNKVRNIETMTTILSELKDLVDLSFLGNPCCGGLSRVEIGKRFERLNDPQCKLLYLNEQELTVEERCEIAVAQGRKDLDLFRLQFCLFQRRVRDDIQSLSLSSCGLRTCAGLQAFTLLVSLDLSGNKMIVLEKSVFACLTALRYLDVCDNDFTCSLVELTDALSTCRQLETLKILHSLRDGSTARRNQYIVLVFESLPSCLKLDGHQRIVGEKDELASSYVPSSDKRVSVHGVHGPRGVLSDKQRNKKKSFRKVRPRKGSSPVIPRIPMVAMQNSESDSPKDDTPGSPSSSSSGSKDMTGTLHELPTKSRTPGREGATVGPSKSPGRETKYLFAFFVFCCLLFVLLFVCSFCAFFGVNWWSKVSWS